MLKLLLKPNGKKCKYLQKCIKYEYKKSVKFVDYDLSLCKKLEMELRTCEEEECEGAKIRSKIQSFEQGEKSAKYFFNLEKIRQKSHTIHKLITTDGSILKTSKEILEEGFNFYSHLYTNEDCDIGVQNSFIDNISVSLNKNDFENCKGKISISELKTALFKMQSNKSPGSDGLTLSFINIF